MNGIVKIGVGFSLSALASHYTLAHETYIDESTGEIIFGARETEYTAPDAEGVLQVIYASPTGSGDGSIGSPYDLQTAFNNIVAGDLLLLRDGAYDIPDNGLRIDGINGTETNPIIVESYPNERAILDGKNRTPQDILDNTYPSGGTNGGLQLTHLSSYIYVRKIDVMGMWYRGAFIGGHHCAIQGCSIHSNFGVGLNAYDNINGYVVPFVGGWHDITDNVVYNNSDVGVSDGTHDNGNNGDGISISSGQDNYVSHNTLYANSDDALDSWKSNDTIFEYNIIYGHGLGEGNGNGVKMGGDSLDGDGNGRRCITRYNLVYGNKASAFDSSGGWDAVLINNTSWDNDTAVLNFGDDIRRNIIQDNISYDDLTISKWDDGYYSNYINNSWNLQESNGNIPVTVVSEDPSSPYFLVPNEIEYQNIGAYA